jgi:hypothetical protein
MLLKARSGIPQLGGYEKGGLKDLIPLIGLIYDSLTNKKTRGQGSALVVRGHVVFRCPDLEAGNIHHLVHFQTKVT